MDCIFRARRNQKLVESIISSALYSRRNTAAAPMNTAPLRAARTARRIIRSMRRAPATSPRSWAENQRDR